MNMIEDLGIWVLSGVALYVAQGYLGGALELLG